MKTLLFFLSFLCPLLGAAQRFELAGRKPVNIPRSVSLQLYKYIYRNDGVNLFNDQFAYIPVYNMTSKTKRDFVDGLYFFKYNSHDSGRLFIRNSGNIFILKNGTTSSILSDYNNFLKSNKLPEILQINYLNIIACFIEYRYYDQNMLEKAGVIMPIK